MFLSEYIDHYYGNKRGNKASFLRDNPHILPQELSRWLSAQLKINLQTGEIYKPTSKQIELKQKSITESNHIISPETVMKLKSCAAQMNMDDETCINYLLDDEIERLDILSQRQNTAHHDDDTPVQTISHIINHHFSNLTPESEVSEYQSVCEALTTELLEKRLINLRVPENTVAESERLPISRTAYYWYGGVVVDRVSKMLGAYDVYLWHALYCTKSEVIFLGTSNNVVACYLIAERLCALLKRVKSAYTKAQGSWGRKKDIEEASNQYIYQFAQGIISPEIFIYDEESQIRLIGYASDRYSYTMD